MYFFTCDIYTVEPDTQCNVYTFSDSRLTWYSQDLSALYWVYIRKDNVDSDVAVGGDDFEAGEKCYVESETASSYNKGDVKTYSSAMCGFKFQVTNKDTYYENDFEVAKDGASSLLLGATAAIIAVLAF